tara:strand:- start:1135 stop:1539 length:405 start_codon:yes stop_codon:yes gene_type:complete
MAIENPTIVEITESVTEVTITDSGAISIDLNPEIVTIEVNNFVLPSQYQDAANVVFVPYGTITSTNLQDALKELADQDFRQSSTPSGINVQEGDTWYDTENNIYKVYREVSSGVFAWTNIVVTDTDAKLDAGAF